MAVNPTSPSGGMLSTLKQQLQVEFERMKADLAIVVTNVQAKLKDVDKEMLTVKEAGKTILEQLEANEAKSVTRLHEVVGNASSEFSRHREAIDKVASEVHGTQKNIATMTAGLCEELDLIRGQVSSLGKADGGGSPAAVGLELRQELETFKQQTQ